LGAEVDILLRRVLTADRLAVDADSEFADDGESRRQPIRWDAQRDRAAKLLAIAPGYPVFRITEQ